METSPLTSRRPEWTRRRIAAQKFVCTSTVAAQLLVGRLIGNLKIDFSDYRVYQALAPRLLNCEGRRTPRSFVPCRVAGLYLQPIRTWSQPIEGDFRFHGDDKISRSGPGLRR